MMSFAAVLVFRYYIISALALPSPRSGVFSRQADFRHDLAKLYDETCWLTFR